MKIAVVDDHDLIREGLNSVLVSNGANNVEKFSTATELVARLDAGESFDFYVIDIELPDLDGFVLIEMIRARNPIARIIVSTVHERNMDAAQAPCARRKRNHLQVRRRQRDSLRHQ